MKIPTYKIQHVLEAYARRLAQEKTGSEAPGRERSRKSSESRQRELIDRVSDRIIRNARELANERSDRVGETPAPWGTLAPRYCAVFRYDEIGPDGRRSTRTLTLDDATQCAQTAEAEENGIPD